MLLTGPLIDQITLHGFIKQVRDVGMLLLPVNSVAPSPPPDITRQKDIVGRTDSG